MDCIILVLTEPQITYMIITYLEGLNHQVFFHNNMLDTKVHLNQILANLNQMIS